MIDLNIKLNSLGHLVEISTHTCIVTAFVTYIVIASFHILSIAIAFVPYIVWEILVA